MISTLKEGQRPDIQCALDEEKITSDASVLRHILFNLISNASKYSNAGKPIFISCSSNDNRVVFDVRDEAHWYYERRSETYVRALFQSEQRRTNSGNWPWFNIVKRYVDLLHGKIEFKSEYRIRAVRLLSLYPEPAMKKILLIEDNLKCVKTLRRF